MYDDREMTGEAPLMSYRGTDGWRVWHRVQASRCLRDRIASVGRKYRGEGRGAGAKLIPVEFALHSGRIGGATKLAAERVLVAVIKKVDGHQTRLWYTLGLTWRTEYEYQRCWGTGPVRKTAGTRNLMGLEYTW